MSRASVSSARPLSLTEELEKLEQSITLTLQEIDHNFSRAHRIVTTSILPVIEQYANHSNAFWKQFFEASANVSLLQVEQQGEEEDVSYAQSHEEPSQYTASHIDDETIRTEDGHHSYDQDDSMLEDNDISGSTPRAPPPRKDKEPQFAGFSSPYEDLRKEFKGTTLQDEEDHTQLPSTPGAKQRMPDMSMLPDSSPFDPTLYDLPSTTQTYIPSTAQKMKDPQYLKMLDKNYRIQATPLTNRKEKKIPANKPSWRDDHSPFSSPPVAAPHLHADIFNSPIRQPYKPNAPRTPGVSVQTPAKAKSKDIFARSVKKEKDEITWESDSDENAEDIYKKLGMSPPKTIQFSLPQSRLLQTPAREASKRIVEDLLTTAGAGLDSTDELDNSPSIVAMRDEFDDSF
ncbi:hypothetical protein SBOR_0899 [Sclerotinia borealis F-4128]|uniref:DASH complex subunit ASK1 n=1 Tax=Sclerotinia borealis (strain F-4128) TaxID=1432307 RepID=W9CS21_SCLBF|nr:hypothetical protein SBOR_0899 [Sclerotinia borealis F-4128]